MNGMQKYERLQTIHDKESQKCLYKLTSNKNEQL